MAKGLASTNDVEDDPDEDTSDEIQQIMVSLRSDDPLFRLSYAEDGVERVDLGVERGSAKKDLSMYARMSL